MRFRVLLPLLLIALAGCGGGGGTGPAPKSGIWTILVYMNAASGLDPDSILNIEQMQLAANNPNVRILVEWKQSMEISSTATFEGTRRYLITPGSSTSVQDQLVGDLGNNVDMGLPQSLSDFVVWGKTNYPAQHYALVLWDHGNGWRPKVRPKGAARGVTPSTRQAPAFSYDYGTGNAIQIWQLPQALSNQRFDMVVWDCSLMQMAEVALELAPNTQYVVGSETSPPGTGFPYDKALVHFQNSPTSSVLTLAKAWVDEMLAVPGYHQLQIEESVVDTTKLAPICAAGGQIDVLAKALISGEPADLAADHEVRVHGTSYLSTLDPPRYFFDLTDLASLYKSFSTNPAIVKAAGNLLAALPNAIVYEQHNANASGSNGLTIDYSPSMAFTPYQTDYNAMLFGQENHWGQWLQSALE